MAEEDHMMTVSKNRLLYDEQTLTDVRDRLEENGVPAKATEIKQAVKTSAHVYEIRTALTYWFGGRMSHRESDRIWMNCEAVDKGEWALDAETSEVVYA